MVVVVMVEKGHQWRERRCGSWGRGEVCWRDWKEVVGMKAFFFLYRMMLINLQQSLSTLSNIPLLVLKFHTFSPDVDDPSQPSPLPPFSFSFKIASFIFPASNFRSSINLSRTTSISSWPPSILSFFILFSGDDSIDVSSSLSEILTLEVTLIPPLQRKQMEVVEGRIHSFTFTRTITHKSNTLFFFTRKHHWRGWIWILMKLLFALLHQYFIEKDFGFFFQSFFMCLIDEWLKIIILGFFLKNWVFLWWMYEDKEEEERGRWRKLEMIFHFLFLLKIFIK